MMGLPMPIVDDGFDNEQKADNLIATPINSDDLEPDFSKMQGLSHLKIGQRGKTDKEIDIRKGISIEKNIKMKEDGKGGLMMKQDFDIIQHSKSNFEGIKGTVIKQTKPSIKSKAAIQSFANAGGVSHLQGLGLDEVDTAAEDDEMSVLEFTPDNSTWETNNNCRRWIVIDGVKPSQEVDLTANIDVNGYIQSQLNLTII